MNERQKDEPSFEVLPDGMILGQNYHDGKVSSITFEKRGEIKIVISSVSGSCVEFLLKGVVIAGCKLEQNDIIAEIFYWEKSNLEKLHDGVWDEITRNFNECISKQSIMAQTDDDKKLLQIYCATNGAASFVIDSFTVRSSQ